MGLHDPSGNVFGRWLQLKALAIAMKLLLRFEITGLDHIPASGPAIIIINHIAFIDPVMVFGRVPRRVAPIAKIEAFDLPVFGLLMKIYGTIPVHRGQADMNAVKQALRLLKAGDIVLVAPEGRRSQNCQLQPAKDGATVLALRSDAPIIPIGVTGTQQFKTNLLKLKRTPVHLSVGQPFQICLPADNKRPSRQEISAITQAMMYRLAAQLPTEYRGVYSNMDEADGLYLSPISL